MFTWLRPRRDIYVVEGRLATHEGAQQVHHWRDGPLTLRSLESPQVACGWDGGSFQARDKVTGVLLVRRNFDAFEDFAAAERFFERTDVLGRHSSPYAHHFLLWRCSSRSIATAPRDLVKGKGRAVLIRESERTF